ncbi:histidine phosphatase family protein [Streptomyces sp. NPDC004542]|uniref:histidine phosphatase family protein n=1 Tax=Streptomyces sp. NPDC004542 TaxID=3154281 RepID=UPI0033B15E17
MTIRLTLVCGHTRDVSTDTMFGHGALRDRHLHDAGAVPAVTPFRPPAVRSPSSCCALTAAALGLRTTADPALRDIDHGTWRGRTRAEVAAADPHGLSAWLTDPDAAPHGGESVTQLCHRAAHWLDSLPHQTGGAVAVAEPAVVKALLVHALSVPARAFWWIEVPPLYIVSLVRSADVWSVRPLDGSFPGEAVRHAMACHQADRPRHTVGRQGPRRARTGRDAAQRWLVSVPPARR